jgi:3-methylcrotonyl-CoA carboxylase beta subunit
LLSAIRPWPEPPCRTRRDGIESNGCSGPAENQATFKIKTPIREQFEQQGCPHYASVRLCDDGIVDPSQARRVLELGLPAALSASWEPTRFGVLRM